MRIVMLTALLLAASTAVAQVTPAVDPAPTPVKQEKKLLPTLLSDLKSAEPQRELASTVTTLIAETLSDMGVFKVITMDEIRGMIDLEAQKQLSGCDDASCFAEIGGAFGAQLLVRGELREVGGRFLLNLQLVDVNKASVEGRVSREVDGDQAKLLEEARLAARLLMRSVLKQNSGQLLVKVSEEGSSIYLDERLIGSSPFPISEVPGGIRLLRVEHDGFISWQREVEVLAAQPAVVDVQLIPSPTFIGEYEQRTGTWRTLGWLGAIGGAALVAGGVGMYIGSSVVATNRDNAINAYNQSDKGDLVRAQSDWENINSQNKTAGILDIVSAVSLVTGVVLGGTGAYMLLTGEDPDRYKAFTITGNGVRVNF